MLVATTRARAANDPEAFTAGRANNLNYAELTISVPTHHVVGSIEWPDQTPPDPTRHFVTTERQILDKGQFVNQVRSQSWTGGPEAHDVLVFIHGYNTLYQEAVYRFAQIVHDSGFTGTAVLFAWPSRGEAPLYLADRDASTYSRDYLEQALLEMSALPEVRHINVMAHSMGNWLTVEALRQAKLKGHGSFNGKLNDIILASPDIDVNVFRTQLDVIGPTARPITIFVSGDDKALAFSTALSGGVDRVGIANVHSAEAIAGIKRYNLRVIDLTNVHEGADDANHSKFAESSSVITAIGKGLASEEKIKAQSGMVTAVSDAGASLLKVPAAIVAPGN
jgi:esterase/lipase superfamily enzyme